MLLICIWFFFFSSPQITTPKYLKDICTVSNSKIIPWVNMDGMRCRGKIDRLGASVNSVFPYLP